MTTAYTEEHVTKILPMKLTRAHAHQDIPATTVKLVSSHVTILLPTTLFSVYRKQSDV